MKVFTGPMGTDSHQHTIGAHNWLVAHAHLERLGIRGRYLIIRMLHHLHGYHKTFKIVDFMYALRWL